MRGEVIICMVYMMGGVELRKVRRIGSSGLRLCVEGVKLGGKE